MTRRELDILRLLHDGLSNAEIAQRLFLSPHTVKWYTREIYSKFGVRSRTAAVAYARQCGLLESGRQPPDEPAASADRKTNLAAPATPFIERHAEVAQITQLLADSGCRLLTLVGPGGIGKTRLALEVAARQLERYPDGVFLVALQPVTAPEFIATAIAGAVGVQVYEDGEIRHAVLDHLRTKTLLLILDNLEHVLDGATFISEILRTSPGTTVLATSREALNLHEEWLFPVPVMAVPPEHETADLESYAAVRLFIHAARRIRLDFSFDDERAGVARICRLVAGMPLAIELAAAWVRTLPCQTIAAEIERSLDILATSARNVPERHRSMRATLDYSWRLLTESERTVFMRLAVFRGGFMREAAEQVANASLRTLSALVDKSLLWRAANGRYDMHELLRQYAEEQLLALPDLCNETRDRHCAYYAAFVEQTFPRLRSFQRRLASNVFEVELDNVRAAWRWALATSNVAEIGRSAAGLHEFYFFRPRYQEALEAFSLAAETLKSVMHLPGNLPIYAHVLACLAHCHMALSSIEHGLARAQQSLAIAKNAESPEAIMHALFYYGLAYCWIDQHHVTRQSMVTGLQIARDTGDLWYETMFLRAEADEVFEHDSLTPEQVSRFKAVASHRLKLARQVGDPMMILDSYDLLGVVGHKRGAPHEARAYYTKYLKLAEELDDVAEIATANRRLAFLALHLKNFAEARTYFRRSVEIAVRAGSRGWQTDGLLGVASLLLAENQKRRAVELVAVVEQDATTMPNRRNSASRMLEEFRSELDPEAFAEAVEAARLLDHDTAVQTIIAELSQPAD